MLGDIEQYQEELKQWEQYFQETCDVCHGKGVRQLPDSTLPVRCICLRKAEFYATLLVSGFPRRFLLNEKSWDDFKLHDGAVTAAMDYTIRFDTYYNECKGVYIYGKRGQGKTLLQSLIMRGVMNQQNPHTRRPYSGCYLMAYDLIALSHVARDEYRERLRLERVINKHDLLIIDNLGGETGSKDYNTRFFEHLIQQRDNLGAVTIIGSTVVPDQLAEHYGEYIQAYVDKRCIQISMLKHQPTF